MRSALDLYVPRNSEISEESRPSSLGERPFRIRELTVDDPSYSFPIPNAKIELKAHQRASLQRCLYMENVGVPFDQDLSQEGRYKHVKTNIGILGDKVGSGKSFTILALMLVNPQPLIKYTKTFVYANGHVAFKMCADESVVCADVNVVVVPHTIARQWMSYVRAFSDDFVPLLINSNKVVETLDDTLSKVNLVVVTCNFYRALSTYLTDRKIQVRRVVFDEVDTAQTPNAKRANAKFYWFVSASYKNVLDPYPRWVFNYDADRPASRQISTGIVNNAFAKNIFATLYKTVSTADQRYIERIVVKSADDFVERSFDLPDPQAHHIVCTSPVEIDILSGITNKNIVRSLNAGDVVTAISYISPSNVNTEDNIVAAVRRDFDMRLANVHVRLAMARDLLYKNESMRSRSIAKVERERGELLEKINLIEERVRTADVCCVCYSAFQTKTVTKCCKNSFCLGCISTWLTEHNTCPMCKAHCAHESFFVVHDHPTDAPSDSDPGEPPRTAPKTKLEALRDIVSQEGARKLIVFSEYDHAFVSIRQVLQELDVRHEMLKGGSVSRIVELYRSASDLRVLLVNPRWSGVGLNLENTTDVVIYHGVTPQMEKQIVGRAHRTGRESALRVWHLRYPNECINYASL